MEFKLVDNETRRRYEIGDAVIFYREALPITVTSIYSKHTRQSETGPTVNIEDVVREMLARHVEGWEGVTLDGQPLAYSVDTLLRIREHPDRLFALIIGGDRAINP
ncbi:MAG: hypothetical protein ACOZEN_06855 [Thermodesulfobacteriota bacterium]